MSDEKLLRACYELMGECGLKRPPWAQWREHASENAEVWPIGGGAKNAELVGFILFKEHTIHIAVKPQWHGRWVRPSMFKAWRDTYAHACDLYATPDANNAPAIALCERLGFRRTDENIGQPDNSIVFVKEKVACQSQH